MEKRISELWDEYERLLRHRDFYAAFTRAAMIWSVLRRLSPTLRSEFEKRCQSVPLNQSVVDSLGRGITKNQLRIVRILSVGRKWLDDEFLLVVTLNIEIDLLIGFLRNRLIGFNPKLNTDTTALIRKAGNSHGNRAAYRRAIGLARLNWGLPIRHVLLR